MEKQRRTESKRWLQRTKSNTLIPDYKISEQSDEEQITTPRYNDIHDLRHNMRLRQRHDNVDIGLDWKRKKEDAELCIAVFTIITESEKTQVLWVNP